MFRKLRLTGKKIDEEDCHKILKNGDFGNLATQGRSSYPYVIPLNYVYFDNCIFFHCARIGHKIDNIQNNKFVCFSVVGNHKTVPEKFTTAYESVIVFGEADIIEAVEEKQSVLKEILKKYSPNYYKEGLKHIDKFINSTAIVKINITHLSGKRSKG